MDYGEMAEDLRKTLVPFQEQPLSLMGHSMGGKTAMHYCLRYRPKLERLIVVDIAPVDYRHAPFLEKALRAMLDLPLESLSRKSDALDPLLEKIGDERLARFLLTNLDRAEGGWRWKINLQGILEALPSIVGFEWIEPRSYEGEVTLISGANSDYVTDDRLRVFAEFLSPTATRSHCGSGTLGSCREAGSVYRNPARHFCGLPGNARFPLTANAFSARLVE